jgi:thymidylate synthase
VREQFVVQGIVRPIEASSVPPEDTLLSPNFDRPPQPFHRNVTNAFRVTLRSLLQEGDRIKVRGSETKELRSHFLQVQRPRERVYILPNRNNNIFAQIAESIWVMGGRNDLAYLSHYLPRAEDFSDDGLTWRAGYGPRLRNWHGVDQVTAVAKLLRQDPNTRRAVMVIFDPAEDYGDSKDIPCNNWLNFLIRGNQLHMNVVVRSNDLIWGFSGINTFEWSILHEMMAYWTGTQVGELSYFVSSLHIYDRHYVRAEKILKQSREKTVYDFCTPAEPFQTDIADLSIVFQRWFEIEAQMRQPNQDLTTAIASFSDPFLRNCLTMLNLYNRHLQGADISELQQHVGELPFNDFRIAAIEYFARKFNNQNWMPLAEHEQAFFDDYWSVNEDE